MIKSKKYSIGRLYLRSGKFYTDIKGVRESTPFLSSQKVDALKLLDSRIEDFLNPRKINTVSELMNEFLSTKKLLNKDTIRRYLNAFTYVLKQDCELSELVVIRKMVRSYLQSNPHSNAYQNKVLKMLRGLFAFGIEDGLMTVNPIKKDMYLKDDSNRRPFTETEIDSIIKQLELQGYFRTANICRFIKITGCRIQEVIDIKLTDIDSEFITIHGKGGAIRFFPIFHYPELREIIEVCKKYHSTDSLFGLKSYSRQQNKVRQIVKELEIEIEYGNFHSIRKYAENDMIFNQNLNNRVVLSMIGHSREIQDKHYLKKLQMNDIKEILKSS